MKHFGLPLGLGLLFLAGGPNRAADLEKKNGPEVKVVSYGQLGEFVKKNRGKVVLVEFWATW
jgi:hypothetical protein